MGLFDRLLGSRSSSVKVSGSGAGEKPAKQDEAFFLDADASTSLGNVEFMRRANTIRHTFPGNADNPGEKEMVQEVDSMQARLEKMTPGLAGQESGSAAPAAGLGGGVPNKPKRTFARQMTAAELEQKLKGSAVKGVNAPASGGRARKDEAGSDQPEISRQASRPGSTDDFRAWAKDLNG